MHAEDERIIKGAIRNDLVDPTEIQACLKLESITTSDIRAAAEVRLANAEIDKMIQEGKKAGRVRRVASRRQVVYDDCTRVATNQQPAFTNAI